MKPFAVIHYLDKGEELHTDVYSQDELERVEGYLKRKNAVFWTCLCNRLAIATKMMVLRPPERAQERLKRHG